MNDCIFCKIIRGEIPSRKIYEDENTYAFLDVNPSTKGHTLVIPKKHYENTLETPEDELNNIIQTTKKIAILLKQKLHADGINIMNANGKEAHQSVFHIHFHVVPRYKDDGLNMWFHEHKKQEYDLDELKKTILK